MSSLKKIITIVFGIIIVVGGRILFYFYVPIMRNPAPDYMRVQGNYIGTRKFNGYLYKDPFDDLDEGFFYQSRYTISEYLKIPKGLAY